MIPSIFRASTYENRRRQIDTLKIFNDNVLEIQADNEYQVRFRSGRNDLTLHVYLSKDFPNDKPSLKVLPVVLHPWVNRDGEICSAPGLLNFTVHSDLGRVVQAIIREFVRNPPHLANNDLAASPSIPIRNNDNSKISPTFYQKFSPPVQQTFQHIASNSLLNTYQPQTLAFPELASMSVEELQFLNECSERREEFLDNLPQSKEMKKTLEDLMTQIEELVDSNLVKKEKIDELKQDVQLKVEEVTKLAFETENLIGAYQNLAEKYSPKNIKNLLHDAADEENNNSEKIAESFIRGDLDVEKFVLDYVKSRSLAQVRKTKEEKLSQQLQRLERAGF